MYSSEQQSAILSRHQMEAEGAGGLAPCVRTVVRGIPRGFVWAHNQHPGPLDGKPAMYWVCDMHYADGTVVTVG